MPETVLGSYTGIDNSIHYNQFNPYATQEKYIPKALGVGAHEGTHAVQYNLLSRKGTAFEESINSDRDIHAINQFLTKASFKAERDKLLPQSVTSNYKGIYKINPLETAPRSIEDISIQSLLENPERFKQFQTAFPNIYNQASSRALANFSNAYPKVAAEAIKRISKDIAVPGVALAAGTAALTSDAEAGPVNLKNLYRGTSSAKVITAPDPNDFSADNILRTIYELKGRKQYRTIDNPIGGTPFGSHIFNADMNIKNLFDPRYDPQATGKIAHDVFQDTGKPRRETIRNLLTGNWDAYEKDEVMAALQKHGYTGNWQLEPTHYQKSDLPELHSFVDRRYQDVYSTFNKDEIAVGDLFGQTEDLYREIQGAHGKTLPLYKGGQELSSTEARKEIKGLITPAYLYNNEPLKQFHPDFKPMLEEYRPDAHFLSPSYENKHLFPPSREGFSLKESRDVSNIDATQKPGWEITIKDKPGSGFDLDDVSVKETEKFFGEKMFKEAEAKEAQGFVYNAENEIDPDKIEFHTGMLDGNLLEAVESLYTGGIAKSQGGKVLAKAIDSLGGYDLEKIILSGTMHNGKLPDWYKPNKESHKVLWDVVQKKLDDPDVPEHLKKDIAVLGQNAEGVLSQHLEKNTKKNLKKFTDEALHDISGAQKYVSEYGPNIIKHKFEYLKKNLDTHDKEVLIHSLGGSIQKHNLVHNVLDNGGYIGPKDVPKWYGKMVEEFYDLKDKVYAEKYGIKVNPKSADKLTPVLKGIAGVGGAIAGALIDEGKNAIKVVGSGKGTVKEKVQALDTMTQGMYSGAEVVGKGIGKIKEFFGGSAPEPYELEADEFFKQRRSS
jgi:hypothetical protein